MSVQLSRRSFLGGAIALAAASVVPLDALALASVPTIYGDGEHDDTAGLQALFRGEPFRVVGETRAWHSADHRVHLSKGLFRVTDTIEIWGPSQILDCHFGCAGMPAGRPTLLIHRSSAADTYVNGCSFRGCHTCLAWPDPEGQDFSARSSAG